jgi:hypothetical protein
MKTLTLDQASLEQSVQAARRGRVLLMSEGKPLAVVVGVQGWDEEDLALCRDAGFWRLIASRRRQKTISRAELERRIRKVEVKGIVGLHSPTGRRGRKSGRPAQAAAGGAGGGNAIAKLIKLSRETDVLKRRIARLEATRKLVAQSPAIRALLS